MVGAAFYDKPHMHNKLHRFGCRACRRCAEHGAKHAAAEQGRRVSCASTMISWTARRLMRLTLMLMPCTFKCALQPQSRQVGLPASRDACRSVRGQACTCTSTASCCAMRHISRRRVAACFAPLEVEGKEVEEVSA